MVNCRLFIHYIPVIIVMVRATGSHNCILSLLVFVGLALFFFVPVSAVSVPVAGFVSNVTSGTTPLHIQFMDVSTNSPTEWIWSFGDGDTSSTQNPTHIYTQAGTYTVTLAGTNDAGSNTVSKTGYIIVTKPVFIPLASFVSNVTQGTIPLTVQFLDCSTNSPTSEVWTFGDGGTATGASPAHTYTSSGTYSVTLTVTNSAGNDTVVRTGYITAWAPVNEPPIASFVSTTTSGTVPRTVQFVDASTNFPVAWLWAFGDGWTSTEQNPLHTYTRMGTYSVTMTATNAWGNDTVTKDKYITVSHTMPVASFVAAPVSGTAPLSVQFSDTSANAPTSWEWTFGDGGSSMVQSPSYVYTSPGRYTVTFSAINAAGKNTVTRTDSISVSPVSAPVASFTADIRQGTAPLTVRFSDLSASYPASWAWSFGDGTGATVENPIHTFTDAGSYTVTLMATNAGGSNTSTMKDFVTVSTPYGYTATTTVPVTTVPTSASSPAATVTTSPAVTQVPTPASLLPGASLLPTIDLSTTGVFPWLLILALLLIICIVVALWMGSRLKKPGRRRGRDL